MLIIKLKTKLVKAVTTSKWDFFDDYQSDNNSKENNDVDENNGEEKEIQEEIKEIEKEQLSSYTNTLESSLYQQYNDQKEQLSEDKRQILREIEVQAVKYQDDIEAGRVERNSSVNVQQQVEDYRNYMLKKVSISLFGLFLFLNKIN